MRVDAIDPDLIEWDYGAWEGLTTAQIREQLGNPAWTVWDDMVRPGGTPGESTTEVGVRAQRVIDRRMPEIRAGLGIAAADVMARAIARGVHAARPKPFDTLPTWEDLWEDRGGRIYL